VAAQHPAPRGASEVPAPPRSDPAAGGDSSRRRAGLPLVVVWGLASAPVFHLARMEQAFTSIDVLAGFGVALLALLVAVIAPRHTAKVTVVLFAWLLMIHGMHATPFYAVVQVALLGAWALAGGAVVVPSTRERRRSWPWWCTGLLVVATALPLLPDITSRLMPWLSSLVAEANTRLVAVRLHLAVAFAGLAVLAAAVSSRWDPGRSVGSVVGWVIDGLDAIDRVLLRSATWIVTVVRGWYTWNVPTPPGPAPSGSAEGEGAGHHEVSDLGRESWWRFPVMVWLVVQATMLVLAFLARNSWRDRAQQDTAMFIEIAQVGPQWPADGRPTVVSFPGYGLAIRWADALVGDLVASAVLVAAAAGLGAMLVLWRWMEAKGMRPSARRAATIAFATFPYAFLALGAAYSDGLFAMLAIGAFLLIERDRPILAGLVGAAATATRPTGIALLAGLVVLQAERAGLLGGLGWPPRLWQPAPLRRWRSWARAAVAPERPRDLRPAQLGVLASAAGIGGYVLYCWRTWGDPVAFWTAQRWYGHGTFFGAATWAKEWYLSTVLIGPWDQMSRWRWAGSVANTLFMAGLTIAAALLIPVLARRYGLGYGVFLAGVVVQTWVGATNFGAAGRYLVVVLPLFALVGELVDASERRWRWAFAASGAYGAFLFLIFMNTLGLPSW
jgi:hypothetical protein